VCHIERVGFIGVFIERVGFIGVSHREVGFNRCVT
jgi:hypothetical protein